LSVQVKNGRINDMTVKQLIEELSKRNPDMRVCVQGYEGGYADIEQDSLGEYGLRLNVNTEGYYGSHEKSCYFGGNETADETALIISR
jgi:hypothetical protein